jgi:hypothetical protein
MKPLNFLSFMKLVETIVNLEGWAQLDFLTHTLGSCLVEAEQAPSVRHQVSGTGNVSTDERSRCQAVKRVVTVDK